MQVINLEQALNVFIPNEALRDQHLKHWFVSRKSTPRRRVEILLRTHRGADPLKILFVGHRGSGKSTELNKLATEIDDAFEVVNFSVIEATGSTTPQYEDVMLALATQVTRACINQRLVQKPLVESVKQGLQGVRDWWRQVITGMELHSGAGEQLITAELTMLLGQVQVSAQQSSETREQLRHQINQQMPALLRHLNWVIEQAQAAGEKRLLLIMEGLDKIDRGAAERIFRDHAPTLVQPRLHTIFTFPLALRYTDDYNEIRLRIPKVEALHNIAPHNKDGTENREGMDTLRRLVLARMKDRLIDSDALDLLVWANGGTPLWLVFLVQTAALYALERNSDENSGENSSENRITLEDAKQAVRELRRELSAPLTRLDIEVLRARHRDRRLTNDAEEQRLLYNGCLIEYTGDEDERWCDAHPALWTLLEQAEVSDKPEEKAS